MVKMCLDPSRFCSVCLGLPCFSSVCLGKPRSASVYLDTLLGPPRFGSILLGSFLDCPRFCPRFCSICLGTGFILLGSPRLSSVLRFFEEIDLIDFGVFLFEPRNLMWIGFFPSERTFPLILPHLIVFLPWRPPVQHFQGLSLPVSWLSFLSSLPAIEAQVLECEAPFLFLLVLILLLNLLSLPCPMFLKFSVLEQVLAVLLGKGRDPMPKQTNTCCYGGCGAHV